MSAFCGFPVTDIEDPMFAEVARAMTYGFAESFNRSVIAGTIGVKIKQMVSLRKKAERIPDVKTSSVTGCKRVLADAATWTAIQSKNPDSRKCATGIMMPSRKMRVFQSMA